jgi:uncharacterized protein (TIGR02996 family)
MRALALAREAAERGDLPRTLTLLLAAWRSTRAIAIADAIDAVSARAAAGRATPVGEAWERAARAGYPVARAALVASLADTKDAAETLARIDLLMKHGPDPRVSAKIADLVEAPAYGARESAFWTRVFALLPELGDPRIAARSRDWPNKWRELDAPERTALEERLAEIRAALDAVRAPALAADDVAACAAIVAALGPAPVDDGSRIEAELVAAVLAAVDDDAPRAVYADWLQQNGDPRGELVALQLAPETPDGARRVQELLAERGARWLAAYGDGILKATARFERGFVAACEPLEWGDSALWATVRECSVPPTRDDQRADSLRVVTAATDQHVCALAKLTKPLGIESLTWKGLEWEDGVWSHDELNDAVTAIEAFRQIRVLPELRRLELLGAFGWFDRFGSRAVAPDDLAWVWSAGWTARLAELALPAALSSAARWLAAVAATRITTLELRSQAERMNADSWRATFAREPGSATWRLALVGARSPAAGWARDSYGGYVTNALGALRELALTEVRVAIPRAAWELGAGLRQNITAALPGATIEQR